MRSWWGRQALVAAGRQLPGLDGRRLRAFRSAQALGDLADSAAIDAEFPRDTPLGPAPLQESFDGVNLCHFEVIGHGSRDEDFLASGPEPVVSKWLVLK